MNLVFLVRLLVIIFNENEYMVRCFEVDTSVLIGPCLVGILPQGRVFVLAYENRQLQSPSAFNYFLIQLAGVAIGILALGSFSSGPR